MSTADPGEVKQAYYRTVRRFHPDRFREGPFASRYREIEQAFRLLHEALGVLTDPQVRVEWERRRRMAPAGTARMPSAEAADLLVRATGALRAGRRGEAVNLLEQAVRKIPGEATYGIHLGLLLLNNPTRRTEAAAMLEDLARRNPARAEAHAAHALALSVTGHPSETQAALRRAFALDAGNTLALALTRNADAIRQARLDPYLALFF